MAGRRTGVTGRGALAFMAGVLAGVAAFVLGIAVIAVPLGSSEQACPETGQPAGAVTRVPRKLAPIFVAAATKYRLGGQGPSIVAAINDVETSAPPPEEIRGHDPVGPPTPARPPQRIRCAYGDNVRGLESVSGHSEGTATGDHG
jgi:hypothetical protein